MKRKITCALLILIILIMLFSFSSSGSGEDGVHIIRTYALGPKKSFVKPYNEEYSPEDQQIIDYYYSEMISLFPQFGTIPREMLRESLFYMQTRGTFNVSFIFCFGGMSTPCRCTFSTNDDPEGVWEVEETGFLQYYQLGMNEKVISKIRSLMYKELARYVDSHHLDAPELSIENLRLYWKVEDGNIYLRCEDFGFVTDATTTQYGCGDHAHIKDKALVEISDKTVKIKVYSATAS